MTDEVLSSWLPAPGSDLYYAHLYLPPATRVHLGAIAALRTAIAGIPVTCSSAEVAQPKLAWWRDELGQLARGTPRHAITRALRELDPALPAAGAALVGGIEAMLGGQDFATRHARLLAFREAHGPLWACALRLCLPRGAPVPDAAMKLAARVEELLALRDVRPQLDCGLRLLATDSLEQAGRPTRSSTEWHASVFAHDFADLVPALQAGLADLPERRALRPLATLARLALATAREIEASDYGIWEARIELTPVRKLWLAWRERAGL